MGYTKSTGEAAMTIDSLTPAERKAMEAGFDLIETPRHGWSWKFDNRSLASSCSGFATSYDAATHALDWADLLNKLSRRENRA
jgi:hypothetical protein